MAPGSAGAPYALALSAHSNVLQEFEGRPGRSPSTASRSSQADSEPQAPMAASGSLTASIRWMAAHIAPGVPVSITA